MRSLLAFLALEATLAAAQKVVNFPIARNERPRPANRGGLAKRQTVTANLGNEQTLYYANVTVGNPGQPISLQIDTGSSDVWVVSSEADCKPRQYDFQNACLGGVFDSSQSSDFTVTQQGGFNISYVDGSGAQGDLFTDLFQVGDTTVNKLTMGLAQQTTIYVGIMGVSFPQDESICNQQQGDCQTFPTLAQQMVQQNKINSNAYSLWLDDLESSTGSILFGGVDTSKYTGDLVALPIVPTEPGLYTDMAVTWTGLTLTTPKGQTSFTQGGFNSEAILDSGTTTLVLPDNIFNSLADQFGAIMSQEIGAYVAPCYLRESDATLDFAFGGSGGPVIKVNVSEFLLDLGTDQEGNPYTFRNGDIACEFGMESAGTTGGGVPTLFGDTFLRSAYVVYDLDNKEIAIGQSNFNSGSSNIKEIASGSSAIPNVASTATAATANASGASAIGPLGGSPTPGSASATPSLGVETGAPPLAQFTTASYSGAGQSSSSSSGQSQAPSAAFENFMLLGLSSAFAVIGSGMLLL